MNLNTWKTSLVTLGLAGAFMLSAGFTDSASVVAQSWRRDHQELNRRNLNPQEMRRREEQLRRQGWDGRLDRNGNVDLNRNGVDDRYEDELFVNDRYNNARYGDNGYGRNGVGGYRNEEPRSYRDDFERGRGDSQPGRRGNLNKSNRYRNGG
jgi:hypothetical protein